MNVLGTAPRPPADVPLEPGPTDSITKLEWNPAADWLAVGSWDSQVRLYEINAQSGAIAPKAAVTHDGPALGLSWSKDGTKLLTCSTDKTAKLLDLNANGAPAQQIAAHDGPISCVKWLTPPAAPGGIAVTAGWDKLVKYWDMRQQNPVATITAPERVYALDSVDRLLVFGTADRNVSIVDLATPGVIKNTKESPLKMQTRVITCFPQGNGYAIGSIEGRVAIQYAEEKDSSANFSFKCHRQEATSAGGLSNNRGGTTETQVYSVNAISFNNAHGTFSTAGSDGSLSFWDKDLRTRLKTYAAKDLNNAGDPNQKIPPTPIVSTGFNKDTQLFAYALSYDWSRGYTGAIPQNTTKVFLHPVQGEEIKPKQKGK